MDWHSVSPKCAWALRTEVKQRSILYLSPAQALFTYPYALGVKAVAAARAVGLPGDLLRALDQAPRYPKGTGQVLIVKEGADLEPVRAITAIKLAN